jgi:hypothetical protein
VHAVAEAISAVRTASRRAKCSCRGARPGRLEGIAPYWNLRRAALFGGWVFLALSAPGTAQNASRPGGEIIIGQPGEPNRNREGPCVEVEIGRDVAPPLNCLNKTLKGQVERIQPPAINPPLDAKSEDIQVGVGNPSAPPAIRQKLWRASSSAATCPHFCKSNGEALKRRRRVAALAAYETAW